MRHLHFLKGILRKDPCNPVKLAYEEMKKFDLRKTGQILCLVYKSHITFL